MSNQDLNKKIINCLKEVIWLLARYEKSVKADKLLEAIKSYLTEE